MTIEVEQSVPAPKHGNKRYPWEDLKPGDSFFAPGVSLKSFRTVASRAAKKLGISVSVQADTVDGVDGARCWRRSDDA